MQAAEQASHDMNVYAMSSYPNANADKLTPQEWDLWEGMGVPQADCPGMRVVPRELPSPLQEGGHTAKVPERGESGGDLLQTLNQPASWA